MSSVNPVSVIEIESPNASFEPFIDAKRQLTPEIIEKEFQNILEIHTRSEYKESILPTTNLVLNHRSHKNGSFKNTIVFREVDDTFISFPHTTVKVSSTNLTQFWKAYEQYKNDNNIILDSRLQLIIMYATLAYADELLVFNSFTTKVVNLYDYCSDLFKIAASELNIRQIQELFIMKMVISFYLADKSIPWQVNQILNNLKELHTYTVNGITKKSIIDIMVNYIKCGSVDKFDRNRINNLFEQFHKYFSKSAYVFNTSDPDLIITRWKIPGLTIEEVFITMMLLKEYNFVFIKNDEM